ncbi:MAG TPA: hypothetical protein VGL18_05840 [Actinomycetota bacterium]|jgi:hypothetical protein
MLLHRRSASPAPYIYLVALITGALLGIGLDAWLGWPWWTVALAFLVLVWLVFLSTAFTGPMRGPSLRDEFLDAIDPGGAPKRREREEARRIRSCPFPFYGLDASWSGSRMLGGHGSHGKEISSVELLHGHPGEEEAWVRIESAPETRAGLRLEQTAWELWNSLERPPADLPPDLRGPWIHRRFEQNRTRAAHWNKVPLPVDRRSAEFDYLEEQPDWIACGVIGGLVVRIRGHRFPLDHVRLVTIADVEQYIEGSRRFQEEQRLLHEG